jgi:hypothetical protein
MEAGANNERRCDPGLSEVAIGWRVLVLRMPACVLESWLNEGSPARCFASDLMRGFRRTFFF